MNLQEIFVSKAKHLSWQRLPAKHVAEGYTEVNIQKDEAYFIIRLKEMYLRNIRVLWRKFYPMLHSYVDISGKESHNVAGPGQLRQLGDANLERITNLNTRLTELIAYKGGDVDFLVGLYSIPGQDAAKAMIDMLSTVANLGGLALGQSVAIANAVKSGVENIVGMNEAQLELGVRDTFFSTNPFSSGYYLAVNAEVAAVDMSQLWLSKSRLVKGSDPIHALPYEDHDYMVLEIERRVNRDDWPSLPEMAKFNESFAQIMRDTTLKVPDKRSHLADLWPQFTQAIAESPNLVRPDRELIASSTSNDLNIRLKAMETSNPFETRAWGSKKSETLKPEAFDLANVADLPLGNNAESRKLVKAALEGNPFSK